MYKNFLCISTFLGFHGREPQQCAKLLDTGGQIPPHHHTLAICLPTKIGPVKELHHETVVTPWQNNVRTLPKPLTCLRKQMLYIASLLHLTVNVNFGLLILRLKISN